MDGTGPEHPLSDAQLDRELESALRIEPSPEFLARVRTRIAAEPKATLWRQAVWGRGFQPFVAAALVAATLAIVIPKMMRDDARSTRVVPVSRVAHISEARPEVQAPVAEQRIVTTPSARAPLVRRSEVPLRLSQPLFSAEERQALVSLLAAVEDGRVPPVATESATVSVAHRDAPTALHIEPLVIEPLPLLAARAQTEGEGKW